METRRRDLQAAFDGLRRQESDWGRVMDAELVGRRVGGRTGYGGSGSVFRNAGAQQAIVRQRIQEVRQDIDRLDQSIPSEQAQMEKQFRREEIGKITNFVTR